LHAKNYLHTTQYLRFLRITIREGLKIKMMKEGLFLLTIIWSYKLILLAGETDGPLAGLVGWWLLLNFVSSEGTLSGLSSSKAIK
jgi:hypothetical protein